MNTCLRCGSTCCHHCLSGYASLLSYDYPCTAQRGLSLSVFYFVRSKNRRNSGGFHSVFGRSPGYGADQSRLRRKLTDRNKGPTSNDLQNLSEIGPLIRARV